MKLWDTVEKHKIKKKDAYHRVKIAIPSAKLGYIQTAMNIMRESKGAPGNAYIYIQSGVFNTYLTAVWFEEKT